MKGMRRKADDAGVATMTRATMMRATMMRAVGRKQCG
jgi:hypothetical protein